MTRATRSGAVPREDRRLWRLLVFAGLAGLLAFCATPARAHTIGISRGEYHVSARTLDAELTFARAELVAAVPGLDADGDGSLSQQEIAQHGHLAGELVVSGLEIRTPSSACEGAFREALATEQDGLALRLAYRCAGEAASIRLSLLESLSLGHRHLASATTAHGTSVRAVVYESRPRFELAVSSSDPIDAASAARVAGPLFRLGIEHILTGYDHLVFLFGLVLVGGRLRSLLLVVTAFTLAHSVTLSLATLGVWAPSARVVEPVIALSIAYVGIENWFVRSADRRWLITFPFGLVHGFGFAGALHEISLPSGQLPMALASFNVGVEAGQLAVLALVLPAVLWLGQSRAFGERGVKLASAAIALAGLVWFVDRLA